MTLYHPQRLKVLSTIVVLTRTMLGTTAKRGTKSCVRRPAPCSSATISEHIATVVMIKWLEVAVCRVHVAWEIATDRQGVDATKELADVLRSRGNSKFQQHGTEDENRKSAKVSWKAHSADASGDHVDLSALLFPPETFEYTRTRSDIDVHRKKFDPTYLPSRALPARESDTDSGARLQVCCVIKITIYLWKVSKNVAERVPHTKSRCYFRFGDDGSSPYSFDDDDASVGRATATRYARFKVACFTPRHIGAAIREASSQC